MNSRLFPLLCSAVFLMMLLTTEQTIAQSSLPSSAAACAEPNQSATIVKPVAPEYPMAERSAGLGTINVLVIVSVDASGSAVGAKVGRSSGFADFDEATMRAALASTYKPAIVNCAPASGTYPFRAQFRPGP
ncbi:MAG: energy transducer TonB [Candidatus Aquilonibacter sp.]|jgi:TonB family protein